VSFLDYDEIEKLVRVKAKKIAGVTNLGIKFSNRMKKHHGLCYWEASAKSPQSIHLNKKFIELNKNDPQVLEELIVHECVHLIPGYHIHSKKFDKKCREFGVEPYGYSKPYKNIKPLFTSYCSKCNNCKKYYAKPKRTRCKLCNGKLKIINHSDQHGK
jgi:predicted SprT family Zn-dependent metalloprotease